jgi:hypothetical protein
VHSQKHNLRGVPPLSDAPRRFDAIQRRHGNVGYDDVGLQALGSVNQVPAVLNGSHDFKLGLQDPLQAFGEHPVIIPQQNPRSLHD